MGPEMGGEWLISEWTSVVWGKEWGFSRVLKSRS